MPLSKEEYESVLAHELEHIRWNDPLSRLVLHVLAALFWWVPLERWNTKIIQDQELACDQGVLNYGFRAHALASSLVKFARLNRSNAFCTALVGKASGSMIRLKALLGTDIVEANFASAGLLLSKKWGMLVLGLEALVFFAMCK